MNSSAIEVIVDQLVEDYDGDPLQLLISIEQVVRAFCHYHPQFSEIAEIFIQSVDRYRSGESKSLDDAFGCHRIKHWRQSDFQYLMANGWAVFNEVRSVIDDGQSETAAVTEVAQQRGKDKDRIKAIYREVGDRVREQNEYTWELTEKF